MDGEKFQVNGLLVMRREELQLIFNNGLNTAMDNIVQCNMWKAIFTSPCLAFDPSIDQVTRGNEKNLEKHYGSFKF